MAQLIVLVVVFSLLLVHAYRSFTDKRERPHKSQRLVALALVLLTASIVIETVNRGLNDAQAYLILLFGGASLLLLLFSLFNPRERNNDRNGP